MTPGARDDGGDLSEQTIARREQRKLRARRRRRDAVWFGMGTFGLVGWSVAVPTLAGLATGILIDSKAPGRYSWTLMMLVIGVVAGCLNAWYWISRQHRDIAEEREGMEP